MSVIPRWAVRAVDRGNRKGKSVGVRLVRYRGKSPHFVHPEQLVDTPWHDWYVQYVKPGAVVLDIGCALHPRVQVQREIRRVLRADGTLSVSAPNRESSWRRQLRAAGLFGYSDPDHKIEDRREEFLAELAAGGFTPVWPVIPAVYDTPGAGAIDALGGVSFNLYARLARWKRDAALRAPQESTGFQVVARPAR